MHLFKEKINFKQPSAGGFAPHLDAPAFVHLAKKPLTVLFVVEDMTIENGCLEVVPGSQKFEEGIPIGRNNCIENTWVEGKEWVPVPLKAGEFESIDSDFARVSVGEFWLKAK
jgi:ectoine hydroxylase-related dioxygenase (phytanoyl-CoA dioxygenase family)